MRVTRILVYEMSSEDMEHQLGTSLPDGVKEFMHKKIHVFTLPSAWRGLRLLKFWWRSRV